MQGALSRMLPNIGGPKVGRRLLLARVVASVLLYAAPIWAKALHGNMSLRRKLAAPYRLSALRVISGFRTVSYDAALVLAGMIPVNILATEMRDIYEARAELGSGIPVEAIRRSERHGKLGGTRLPMDDGRIGLFRMWRNGWKGVEVRLTFI